MGTRWSPASVMIDVGDFTFAANVRGDSARLRPRTRSSVQGEVALLKQYREAPTSRIK